MARLRPEDIEKEKLEQDMENYGDESYAGQQASLDSDDDVDEMMKKAVGEDFEEEDELNLAKEIEEDEEEASEKPIDNYLPDPDDEKDVESVDPLLEIERKEGIQTDDPMTQVSDDDFGDDDEEDQE